MAFIPGETPNVTAPIQYPYVPILPKCTLLLLSQLYLAHCHSPNTGRLCAHLVNGGGSGVGTTRLSTHGRRSHRGRLYLYERGRPNLRRLVRSLYPPGPRRGVIVKNCVFDSVGTAGWAIATEYYLAESVDKNRTEPLYQSLTVEDLHLSGQNPRKGCPSE